MRVSIAIALIMAACAPALFAEEGTSPLVNFIAADGKYAEKSDALIPNAAMRLVAAEMAARHGLSSRWWMTDDDQPAPADAYPRVVANEASIATSGVLRLRRIKDEIICSGQRVDREPEVELWRGRLKLPPKLYVGLFAPTNAKPRGKKAHFYDVKLNDKVVEQWQVKSLGPVSRLGSVSLQGVAWMVSAAGNAKQDPQEMPGTFAYVEAEGDFDLRGQLLAVEGEGEPLFAGFLCRSGFGAEDFMIGPMTRKNWSGVLCRLPGWKHYYWGRDWTGHLLAVDFYAAPMRKKLILVRGVSPGSWQELKSHIDGAATSILRELTKELKLATGQPRAPTAPTPEQAKTLAAARAEIFSLAPERILAASRQIDRVLNESPTCAVAHSTAALCGAMLACQDLFHRFDRRDYVLAGPMAHLILADRLYKAQKDSGGFEADRKLAEAWVMLAAGYLDAALELVQSLPPESADRPEAKAARMFVTRDYRPYNEQTILRATPIEQYAWVCAVQECGRYDLMQRSPTEMALRGRAAALLPNTVPESVDAWHGNSLLLIALALHADVSALLQSDEIPVARRMDAAKKLAAAVGAEAADDLDTLRNRIQSRLLGEITDPYATVAALTELYGNVRGMPVGPVTDGQGTKWRTIGLPEFVEMERGFLTMALLRRAQFVFSSWGVPDEAIAFTEALSKSARDPALAELFSFVTSCYRGESETARPILEGLLKTSLGQRPGFRAFLGAVTAGNLSLSVVRAAPHAPGCDGAWSWGQQAAVHGGWNWEWMVWPAIRTVGVDSRSCAGLRLSALAGGNPSLLEEPARAMPYHNTIQINMAWQAERSGNVELAVRTYSEMVQRQPRDVRAYSLLVGVYQRNGQRVKAIETVQAAVKNCEFSVQLSNLMGRAARWLVDEGRVEEGLKMGQAAAQSYSGDGLWGLAYALEASKQLDAAEKVYRETAVRYAGCCGLLMDFLIRQKRDNQQVVKEMDALLKEHGAKYGRMLANIAADRKQYRLLELLYEQKVIAAPPNGWLNSAMICAMHNRDFDQALIYSQRIAKEGARTPGQLVWSYIALRMGAKGVTLAQIRSEMQAYREDKQLGQVIRHLLGEMTVEELLQAADSDFGRAYAYWLMGVEAEVKKDLRAALEQYRETSKLKIDSQAYYTPRLWIGLLERDLASMDEAVN